MIPAIEKIREATTGSDYEGRLYLVGGVVRDSVMGLVASDDVDIVFEGDSALLAEFLHKKGVSQVAPVIYKRYGTAMLLVDGSQVELVGARKESYASDSRKPATESGSLHDDILRRDFTINTLLSNLHTGETIDMTGMALADIESGIIRTTNTPLVTFADDPLRMLRAIRFAARFDFTIEEKTWDAIVANACRLEIVSAERVRDEFVKMVVNENSQKALGLMRESGLLAQLAPELADMHGVEQNRYHIYDVWTHTLKTIENLPHDAPLRLVMAALLHDIGKPQTRTVDAGGDVHFYSHEKLSATLARKFLQRLRFSSQFTEEVVFLVSMHMRVGDYSSEWTDSAVRRLIRDAGDHLEELITLTIADKNASNPEYPGADIQELRSRTEKMSTELCGKIESPLTGYEIMKYLHINSGPLIGTIKTYLENRIIEGELSPQDKEKAKQIIAREFAEDTKRES